MPHKGYKQTLEHKSKGKKINSGSFKKGTKVRVGLKHTEASKEKNRQSHLGKKLAKGKFAWNKGGSSWNKGLKLGYNSGDKHPNWKGGITPLTKQIRGCLKMRQWISDIFTRDNFTCQECFIRGGDLEAHHIHEFWRVVDKNQIESLEQALNCAELWNLNNGQTLCRKCHDKTKWQPRERGTGRFLKNKRSPESNNNKNHNYEKSKTQESFKKER